MASPSLKDCLLTGLIRFGGSGRVPPVQLVELLYTRTQVRLPPTVPPLAYVLSFRFVSVLLKQALSLTFSLLFWYSLADHPLGIAIDSALSLKLKFACSNCDKPTPTSTDGVLQFVPSNIRTIPETVGQDTGSIR